MMEAAPAPQGVNIPAVIAGAAIGKAIAIKGNITVAACSLLKMIVQHFIMQTLYFQYVRTTD
jgi:hypothetical protein